MQIAGSFSMKDPVQNDDKNDAQTLIISVRQNDLLKLIKANKKNYKSRIIRKIKYFKENS